VFTRLKDAGLKLSPKKCNLLQRPVSFLGHIVSEDGVSTDQEKITAVQNWPTPKKVRSFLGLCSYYRRCAIHFADIARPLHKLTAKEQYFTSDEGCDVAFDKLKRESLS